MMQWGIEDPNGAAVGGTCTDGWDAQMFVFLLMEELHGIF